jgi:hypothetical protein
MITNLTEKIIIIQNRSNGYSAWGSKFEYKKE